MKKIVPAYQALSKLKIYHSDTMVDNVIYSLEKRGFIIIDFGVANVVSEDLQKTLQGVNMSSYIRGGTDGYNSP